ncbi:MAG: type VI secretion system baseplate subunit TssE [Planctomycetes bacterium]|nr:type VI secretion system baseplate subunit TssE [Planctomycetota bacterium]
MFQKRTLLERLRSPEGTRAYSMQEDRGALLRSILHNLSRILNARRGQSPALPDFGIPAPNEIAQGYPESVTVLQKLLRQCIEKYEPRLKDVQVLQLDSDDHRLAVRFQISARLATTSEGGHVSFDTLIEPSGHIEVAG